MTIHAPFTHAWLDVLNVPRSTTEGVRLSIGARNRLYQEIKAKRDGEHRPAYARRGRAKLFKGE